VKHLFVYTVLFCLAFLNVPRAFVHDCDSHHEKDTQHEHTSELSIDQDDCFACEFQLDYFEVPTFSLIKFHFTPIEPLTTKRVQKALNSYVPDYALRGPPNFV